MPRPRRSYHRSREREAQTASRASSPEDAARRLALRCGLLEPRQRHTLTGEGAAWMLELQASGRRWRLDLRTQEFEEIV
jgi:hypothetical protein